MGLGPQKLTAQLIAREATPRLVTQGVTVTFAVEGGPQGKLEPSQEGKCFLGANIALTPYPKDGGFAPYPVATLQAREDATGRILAETLVVLPVSTELGCKNCHGGPWKHQVAGIADQAAGDVLKAHDRLSATRLSGKTTGGLPVLP